MGRRCNDWDYRQRAIYLVTLVLADRSRPILGRLEQRDGKWAVRPSALGAAVLDCWRDIASQWPGVEPMECQLMPEHFHGLVFIKTPQQKPLGAIIGSFKAKTTRWYRDASVTAQNPALDGAVARGATTGLAMTRDASVTTQNPALDGATAARGATTGLAMTRDARVTAQNPALDGAVARDGAPGPVDAALRGGAPGSAALRGGALGPAGSAASRSRDALPSLWATGYVDNILWRRGQLRRMVDYMADNPRRLAEKRAHPDLFKVLRALAVELGDDPTWHGPRVGWFAAIGNHNLLARPRLYQVQCSRSYFEYRRERLVGGSWRILHDAAGEPLVAKTTPEFEAKAAAALAAAAEGAVLVCPAISHGEREIARRAHKAGYAVIALINKGFSELYKPGGRLFDDCADGRLLLLAPAAWPYVPGEKPITRLDALALNRLAQLIARDGAAKIDYKGARLSNVDILAAAAVNSPK